MPISISNWGRKSIVLTELKIIMAHLFYHVPLYSETRLGLQVCSCLPWHDQCLPLESNIMHDDCWMAHGRVILLSVHIGSTLSYASAELVSDPTRRPTPNAMGWTNRQAVVGLGCWVLAFLLIGLTHQVRAKWPIVWPITRFMKNYWFFSMRKSPQF